MCSCRCVDNPSLLTSSSTPRVVILTVVWALSVCRLLGVLGKMAPLLYFTFNHHARAGFMALTSSPMDFLPLHLWALRQRGSSFVSVYILARLFKFLSRRHMIGSVRIRDLLQSSGPPQAEVRIASRGKCKKYKANTTGHSVWNPNTLGHPVAK